MATIPPTGASPQQIPQKYDLSEQNEFDTPACPMNCNACKSWSCPGQRRLSNYDGTFSAIIGIGTLGGGFTFTVIFSTLDTRNGTLTPEVIDRSRHFLVVAWVLFILAVTGAAILAFHCRASARSLIERFDRFESTVIIPIAACLDGLQLLILAAFLMSARALKPYDKDTAQAAIILIFIAGGALILMLLSDIQ
jgi:hypothetical protein